jgi:UDP:flavonoid glycosyltransferase YjiC (YdhE family)
VGRLDVLGPLAAACEDAGHDVAFAGRPSSLAALEAAGFEALPAGLDVDAEPDHVAAALAGDLAPLAAQWGAQLVVHDDREGAEATGLPTVCVATRPARGDFSLLPASFQPWPEDRPLMRPGPFPPVEADVAVGPADWAFVMRALTAGKPLAMAPRDDDERYLAFRVCAAGAGRLHRPGAIEELHEEPLYYANAQRIRRELEAMPSPAAVAPLLTASNR